MQGGVLEAEAKSLKRWEEANVLSNPKLRLLNSVYLL
jgi:hypothetical protein